MDCAMVKQSRYLSFLLIDFRFERVGFRKRRRVFIAWLLGQFLFLSLLKNVLSFLVSYAQIPKISTILWQRSSKTKNIKYWHFWTNVRKSSASTRLFHSSNVKIWHFCTSVCGWGILCKNEVYQDRGDFKKKGSVQEFYKNF